MDSENFGAGRDLLYLAFLFLGSGLGCFLNWFRLSAKLRFRNRCVTIGFVLLSAAVAFFAVSLILTNGKFITASAVYITGAVIALLFVLSARFPKAAGFPLLLAAGIVIVWIAWQLGQFPRIDRGEKLLANMDVSADGQVSFEIIPGMTAVIFNQDGAGLNNEGEGCKSTVAVFGYDSFFPAVGGAKHGKIIQIENGGKTVYTDPRFADGLPKSRLANYFAGFDRESFLGKLNLVFMEKNTFDIPPEFLYQGNSARIFYGGEQLIFR
ncbi:MAG: hypothetical protein FWD78_07860 [Treponema sp.]|nr:hypothetical protein [Treponema sp.]